MTTTLEAPQLGFANETTLTKPPKRSPTLTENVANNLWI